MSKSRAVEPFDPNRISIAPSSVYSQESPQRNPVVQPIEYTEYSPEYDYQYRREPSTSTIRPESEWSEVSGISPPDTPTHYEYSRSQSVSPFVSPIEGPSRPPDFGGRQDAKEKSRLPVMKKTATPSEPITRFGKSPGWRRTDDASSTITRWDDYSGEPTNEDTGREASVKPGQSPLQQQIAESRQKNKQLLNGLRERDPAKRKLLNKKNLSIENNSLDQPVEREPWHGASGRVTLVSPVKNEPSARVAPLKVPDKRVNTPTQSPTVQTAQSPRNNSRKSPSPASPPTPRDTLFKGPSIKVSSPKSPPNRATVRPVIPSDGSTQRDEGESPVKPVVPLKVGRNSPPTIVRSPVTEHPQSPITSTAKKTLGSPVVFQGENQMSGAIPSPAHDEGIPFAPYEPDRALSSEPSQTQIAIAKFHEQVRLMKLDEQPDSRFSTTTYATTAYDSPPSTPPRDQPPIPTMPSAAAMRRRPIPNTSTNDPPGTTPNSNNKPTIRKQTPSSIRTSSVHTAGSGTSKSLPQCPPEIEAVNKIAALEARLDDLGRRKRNVSIILRELTQVIQPSPIAYDMAARGEVKKTVAALKDELAEIGQEEHEVGLLLHRALRKRDLDNIYEPTGLWVNRVTS